MTSSQIGDGPLTAKVLEYNRIIAELVQAAKQPGFDESRWAPLAELIAVDDFERVGILREVMTWQQYAEFLTGWAKAKGFSTVVRRVTELRPFVFFEVEEHHDKDGQEIIVNSMNVFEFDDDDKIRHLDVYLQGQLYANGAVPDYAQRPATPTS